MFAGCDKDDICLEDKTPSLIIRFYDINDQDETKTVELDSIYADGLYAVDDTTSEETDSIAIPLDLNNDFTKYYFESEGLTDTINFTYIRNEIYVSRSCGYIINYEDFEADLSTSNWIKDIEIINNSISDEETAHIHIFH